MKCTIFAIGLYCTCLLWLTGCSPFEDLDDVSVAEHDAEYAIPVLQTHARLQDFLVNIGDSTNVLIGADGLLTLYYQGDVVTRSGADILQSIQEFGFPIIPVTDTVVAAPFTAPDGIEIDYVILKEGICILTFKSKHPEDVHVKVTIPNLTRDGVPFTREYDLDYTGNGDVPAGSVADLTGYRLAAENDSIYIRYEAIRASGIRDTLSDFLIITNNLKFGYAEGYWGQELQDSPRDTINIDFFKNWQQGNVHFQNPRVRITAYNSFGFPSRIKTNIMDVLTVNGQVLPLQSDFLNTVYFNYPSFDEVGQTKVTVFDFNTSNSNIADILGAGPIALDYDVDVLSNPDGNTGTRGFITDMSTFRINMAVELPLYGSAKSFAAQDTFAFDVCALAGNSEALGCEDINSVELKIVADNELPVAIAMQLYLLDENNALIDSVEATSPTLVAAAGVDANGYTYTAAPQTHTWYGTLPVARIGNLARIKKLLVKNEFSTTQDGSVPVRITANQQMRMRMGMKVGIRR